MKQVLQNLKNGQTEVTEVPQPSIRPGFALVQTAASLVSAGTERMLVDFASKSLVGKARSRPDLFRQLLDKARREGVLTTLEAAFNRLDQPMSLGYSSAGTIAAIGTDMQGFYIGQRVACAGSGFAAHAEYNLVPKNLLIPLPETVDFDSAAFATLGAIAMHGFRLAELSLGESVGIIGLGLIGQLAVQIAAAAGCNVFGIDLDPARVALARQFGTTAVTRPEALESAAAFTGGRGLDAVLICADTKSDDPINLAAEISRDRGRVVSVGAVGLGLQRKLYYDKEITFLVSRSYGPGRYDAEYEERGRDYPYGYIRWTEGRNLHSFIDLLSARKISVHPLISHRFPIEQAPIAYNLVSKKTDEPFLGVLLTYPQKEFIPSLARSVIFPSSPTLPISASRVGLLGAGNYASAVFLPSIQKAGGVTLIGVASGAGLTAAHAAKKYGFQYATSDENQVLKDPQVNTLAILTRHHLHSRQIIAALSEGKHVYCEKPLVINQAQLDELSEFLQQSDLPLLMAGFNRRFAPLAIQLKAFLEQRQEPLFAIYRVNAGYIPPSHWLHDPAQGGGRIIGEGCHFVDFLTFLAGAAPAAVTAQVLPDVGRYRQDNAILTLTFPDGSIGTVIYLANGDKTIPKERLEVFSGGRVAILDDFRLLQLTFAGRRTTHRSLLRQDKGHQNAWKAFLNSTQKGLPPPIPYDELIGVAQTCLDAQSILDGIQQNLSQVSQVAPANP